MSEEWYEIPGYECLYELDKLGNVRSIERKINHRGRTITLKQADKKTRVNNWGYVEVRLSKAGITKTFFIHRLLALVFIPNPRNLKEVNHIDGKKTNNELTNLEWVTHSENMKHAVRRGLRSFKSKPVYDRCSKRFFKGAREAAEHYNIHVRTLRNYLSGNIRTNPTCLRNGPGVFEKMAMLFSRHRRPETIY